jgi:hypothetical protein
MYFVICSQCCRNHEALPYITPKPAPCCYYEYCQSCLGIFQSCQSKNRMHRILISLVCPTFSTRYTLFCRPFILFPSLYFAPFHPPTLPPYSRIACGVQRVVQPTFALRHAFSGELITCYQSTKRLSVSFLKQRQRASMGAVT